MILLFSIGEILLFLIFLVLLRCNNLREDNTAQLKQLNRNMTIFNDREELIKTIKDLNKKINKII